MLKGIYHFQYCSQFDKAFQPQTCSFPKLWKCARIVPIPKKGDLSLPEDYHPIFKFYHSWASFLKDTFTELSPTTCSYLSNLRQKRKKNNSWRDSNTQPDKWAATRGNNLPCNHSNYHSDIAYLATIYIMLCLVYKLLTTILTKINHHQLS